MQLLLVTKLLHYHLVVFQVTPSAVASIGGVSLSESLSHSVTFSTNFHMFSKLNFSRFRRPNWLKKNFLAPCVSPLYFQGTILPVSSKQVEKLQGASTMVLMAITLPIQVQMGGNFACNLSFTQILYRWCLGIKAWPTDRDRSNFFKKVRAHAHVHMGHMVCKYGMQRRHTRSHTKKFESSRITEAIVIAL